MRAISTDNAAPSGGPFSQAVIAGDFVYLAGAVPRLPDGTWVRGSFVYVQPTDVPGMRESALASAVTQAQLLALAFAGATVPLR